MNKIRKIITWFKIKFGRKPRIVSIELLEDIGEEPRLILHKTDGRWESGRIKERDEKTKN